MKCFVYRNLSYSGHAYSIRAMEGPHKGRVIAHADQLRIDNATFVVLKAGQARARVQKQKNVHAGIVGDVSQAHILCTRLPHQIGSKAKKPPIGGFCITYNPWKWDTFVNRDTEDPVHECRYVTIDGKDVLGF